MINPAGYWKMVGCVTCFAEELFLLMYLLLPQWSLHDISAEFLDRELSYITFSQNFNPKGFKTDSVVHKIHNQLVLSCIWFSFVAI